MPLLDAAFCSATSWRCICWICCAPWRFTRMVIDKRAFALTTPFDQPKAEPLKIRGTSTQTIGIIPGLPQHDVAVLAQRSTNPTSVMVMIKALGERATDSTRTRHPLVVLFERYAMRCPYVLGPDVLLRARLRAPSSMSI